MNSKVARIMMAGWLVLGALGWIEADAQKKAGALEVMTFRVPPPIGGMPPILENRDVSAILAARGVTFPPGASAIFYSAAEVVSVRNTRANLDIVADYVHNLTRQGPKVISMTVHLVQAPGPRLRLLSAAFGRQGDQTIDLQQLLAEAGKESNSVQVLHTLFVETKGGQRCTVESITDYEYTQDLRLDVKGRAGVEGKMRLLGFRMEVDPVIGADDKTIDLNLAPELTVLWQKPRQENLVDPISGGPLEMAIPEFQSGKVQTAVTMLSGQTRLIAVWPAKGDLQLRDQDLSQGVFLTTHVVPQPAKLAAGSSLPPPPKNLDTLVEHTFVLPTGFFDHNTSTTPGDLNELLRLNGMPLPKGSQVTLVPPNRLVVKTSAEMLQVVGAWVDQFATHHAKTMNMTLEVVRAPASMLRPLIQEFASQHDHTTALKKVHKAIAAGQARQVTVNHLETRGGQRARILSSLDRHLLNTLSWQGSQQPTFQMLHRPVGLSFEIDPVVSVDCQGVDANYALNLDYAPPTTWQETLSDPASKRRFLMPRNDFHHANIQTANFFTDGATKIIGLWRPVGEGGKTNEDVLEAAFMTCRIVPHVLPENSAVTTGHAAKSSVRPLDNQKLLFRTFRVPPDFLSSSGDVTDAVPPPPERPSRPLALDILKAQGLLFPEGSSASFDPVTSELIVVNTEANMALVETFVDSIMRLGPKVIKFTLHILEAPASLMGDLLTTHAASSDHTAVLNALLDKGAGRSLANPNITTKGGQRATVAQVQEHLFLQAITLSDKGETEVKRDMMPVGTTLEIDPVIGADGLTMDLNLSLTHHPAPPVLRVENLATADAPPIEVPLTDFHIEKYEGSVTLMSGTARILAVWKPTGRPEFEEKNLVHIAILEGRVVEVKD